ncbi:hypothetical protein AVDCRST_MAG92-2768 [uncultured Coleofasciculus sp.]|uniref:Uncharacterized protein n=1 Tax=uncultured Coleofasciculus sp. TaxID=1267456 RepID=A0A6J4J0H5_9CYAN|nr:hypothetical protein AVDCRST_MAG92-2768 [uncultured Coleofasciculus sp.]
MEIAPEITIQPITTNSQICDRTLAASAFSVPVNLVGKKQDLPQWKSSSNTYSLNRFSQNAVLHRR